MAQVLLTDEAKDDIRDLNRSAQVQVLKALKKLETEPEKRGQPLGSRATSNLTGLRKLVIGNRQYRAVYRVEPSGDVCVVWVIGERADDACYELAMARLAVYTDNTAMREHLKSMIEGAWTATN